MTADAPYDFDYEPVTASPDAATKRAYWGAATGLQQVDGLATSAYAKQLAQEHIEGHLSLEEVRNALNAYYENRCSSSESPKSPSEYAITTSVPTNMANSSQEHEADQVSQRIVELLCKGVFAFTPAFLNIIHENLFAGLDDEKHQPGVYKTEPLRKSEAILNEDSVVYADPSLIEQSLQFAFSEEANYAYDAVFDEKQLDNFARFIARIWQVHPFSEGNTRTVATFAILYLRFLGFEVNNAPFEANAHYFRDALVRANYRNAQAGVMPTREFLVHFFDNVLNGENYDLQQDDLTVHSLFENPSLRRNL